MKYFLGVLPIPSALWSLMSLALFIFAMTFVVPAAYSIRIFALEEYGKVIHEFDPWFNFRATQYLSKKGWHAFFHWFDYMSWYPLGRPVGTTIYPGLQLTAVGIHRAIKLLHNYWDPVMFPILSLNHVCCYLPAWFGAVSSVITGLLSWECTGSVGAGMASGMIMAYLPAHAMRSVGGGFDNESIGIPAIVCTFYLWVRSLRTSNSWWFGILTGLSYGYMVAAWGGFVIVLNAIAAHAACLALYEWLRGNFCANLHRAFSLFYVIGTALAVCVPPVNTQPFRSLEQLSPMVVFVILQGCYVADYKMRHQKLTTRSAQGMRLHVMGPLLALLGLIALAVLLFPTGYFGPLSSRVRSLFMQHTKTGNPLVDSVAEHRPASDDAYRVYLHHVLGYARFGGLLVLPFGLYFNRLRAASFIFLYSVGSLHFSHKMSRLILLLSPGAAVMSGCWLGGLAELAVLQLFHSPASHKHDAEDDEGAATASGKSSKKSKAETRSESEVSRDEYNKRFRATKRWALQQWETLRWARIVGAFAIGYQYKDTLMKEWKEFVDYSVMRAHGFSQPRLMWKDQRGNIVDDYREGYWFLRDKTPKDSRVMAWWDYGYQITGIGERTSLADGNTWNHEHIATIGFMLSSEVEKSHRLVKHVADYVLLWCGSGPQQKNKDLFISHHFARIGNSVYPGHCAEPGCSDWGTTDQEWNNVYPKTKKSLVWNLCKHPFKKVDERFFKLAYQTKHGLMSIFEVQNVSQSSKQWLADPANRDCDAPGSWYCTGNYPPVKPWEALLKRRKNFAQLEDFNTRFKNK